MSNETHLSMFIDKGAEDLPHLWVLETSKGMWVATFPKLVEEARPLQAKIIKDMVALYNAKGE